jgi:hypothetical protein
MLIAVPANTYHRVLLLKIQYHQGMSEYVAVAETPLKSHLLRVRFLSLHHILFN